MARTWIFRLWTYEAHRRRFSKPYLFPTHTVISGSEDDTFVDELPGYTSFSSLGQETESIYTGKNNVWPPTGMQVRHVARRKKTNLLSDRKKEVTGQTARRRKVRRQTICRYVKLRARGGGS